MDKMRYVFSFMKSTMFSSIQLIWPITMQITMKMTITDMEHPSIFAEQLALTFSNVPFCSV